MISTHAPRLPPRSIAVVLGTRPEIIKLGQIIRLLGSAAAVVHTGQHYDKELSETFFRTFGIRDPQAHLGVGGKSRGSQIGSAVSALDEHLTTNRPLCVVVQGDTNAALAGGIAANALEIPLVHVEAGLRSYDRRMPEEHNRVIIDHLADLLCAPTTTSQLNLINEGIGDQLIRVTGNTVVEAVHELMPSSERRLELLRSYGLEAGKFVLSTFHRPENVDDPDRFRVVLGELASLALPVVLPLHPRSRERASEYGLGGLLDGLHVIEPIGYEAFLGLGSESAFLVSDSGGVQEEVSVYKRSVVVVRRSTERPEVLGSFARLVEPGPQISEIASEWIDDLAGLHGRLAQIPSPYGDGSASERVVGEVGVLVGGS